MADLTGGELVAKTLKQAGVNHIFTLCGGHILPIYEGCLTHGIRIIDVRHEQAAAHAADAYARLTRGIGVAAVTRATSQARRHISRSSRRWRPTAIATSSAGAGRESRRGAPAGRP